MDTGRGDGSSPLFSSDRGVQKGSYGNLKVLV
jgi:hypothetical protein